MVEVPLWMFFAALVVSPFGFAAIVREYYRGRATLHRARRGDPELPESAPRYSIRLPPR